MSEIADSTQELGGQRAEVFRLLVESVRDYGIFLLDPDGYILTWNEGARRIEGYAADEIIGKHFSIFYPPQDVKRGKPEYELKVAALEGRWEEEGWRVRQDGSRFWANVLITALRDPSSELIGFAKVTRDLSERKYAEDERAQLLTLERAARSEAEAALERLRAIQNLTDLALSHLRLDDLLNALLERIADILVADTVTVLLLDEGGAPELVARAAVGLEEEVEQGVRIPVGGGFAGRIAQERRPIILDDVDHANVLNPILRQKGLKSMLGVPLMVRNDVIGVLHVGALRHRRFSESDTQFLQIVADRVALAIDHARLIETAAAARREVEIADATARSRDEFLSIAAHELRTPTTSLRIATQMLLRRFEDGEAQDQQQVVRALRTIDRQTGRLDRLVTQLIETVRAQVDRVKLQRVRTDLTELVNSAVEIVQSQTRLHELTVIAPGPVWVSIDPIRFDQVVSNLLDNAVKYSPSGGKIDIEIMEGTSGGARLTVRDRGLGIDLEHRPHLFERFYRAHGSDYRSGMGLGLFISREIVHLHGGEILFEFPPDGGTRFVVELPDVEAEGG
ncbi:MAG TPA: ATP-binding protein [Chloroflexota bacterium]